MNLLWRESGSSASGSEDWYGWERLTKTVWQDLIDRFEQATHEDGKPKYQLFTYEVAGGIWPIHSTV